MAPRMLALPLGLRLRLPAAAGMVDLHRHRQRLRTAAIAGSAHGRCAEIVEPDRDADMGVGGADAVGGIEADPAETVDISLRPGMARVLMHRAVGAQEVAGDEARRHAAAAGTGDEDVRVVL